MSAMPENHSQQVTEAIYTYIASYLEAHGYAPSHFDILEGCDVDRTALARALARLELQGRIRRRLGKPRSLVLVESA